MFRLFKSKATRSRTPAPTEASAVESPRPPAIQEDFFPMADDARALPNEALLETSFLYGANAVFVEEMHARFIDDPNSVDSSWRNFFQSLGDKPQDVRDAVEGPSWYRPELAQPRTSELTALLDGNWAALTGKVETRIRERLPKASIIDVQTAARDSVRALMMIRAYRARGHINAKLDPLGLESHGDPAELEPQAFGFSDQDIDRPIFLDGVLGLEHASVREMVDDLEAHVLRYVRRRIHAHHRSGGKILAAGTHRGAG